MNFIECFTYEELCHIYRSAGFVPLPNRNELQRLVSHCLEGPPFVDVQAQNNALIACNYVLVSKYVNQVCAFQKFVSNSAIYNQQMRRSNIHSNASMNPFLNKSNMYSQDGTVRSFMQTQRAQTASSGFIPNVDSQYQGITNNSTVRSIVQNPSVPPNITQSVPGYVSAKQNQENRASIALNNLENLVDSSEVISDCSKEMSNSLRVFKSAKKRREIIEVSPFHEVADYLIQPEIISVQNPDLAVTSFKEVTFRLGIHANSILAIKRRNSEKKSSQLFILLRLFTFFPGGDILLEDSYPKRLSVVLNGSNVPIPYSYINPDKEPKRPHIPIDITDGCNISINKPNYLRITFVNQPAMIHEYCVCVVRKISSTKIAQNVIQRIKIASSVTAGFIKNQLFPQADDMGLDVEDCTHQTVKLQCPISYTKMKMPVRSQSCKHFQCFDLESYLQMNETRPTWTCPVCDKSAKYENLMVDELFYNIISTVSKETISVIFDRNLEWLEIKECAVPADEDIQVEETVIVIESGDEEMTTFTKSSIKSESIDRKSILSTKPGVVKNVSSCSKPYNGADDPITID